jgi:isoleucyl-tRNA synthetase
METRQKAGIKVRQPLSQLRIKSDELENKYTDLIKDELNVKEIKQDKNIENEVSLDTKITEELKEEGIYRELVRALQDMRKEKGLTPSDLISVLVETNDVGKKLIQKFENEMKKIVLISQVDFRDVQGEEIKIEDMSFKVEMKKVS